MIQPNTTAAALELDRRRRAIVDLRRRIKEGRSIRRRELSVPLRPYREEALEHLEQEGLVYRSEDGWHVGTTGARGIRLQCPRGCSHPTPMLEIDLSAQPDSADEDEEGPHVVAWCQCCGLPVQITGLTLTGAS